MSDPRYLDEDERRARLRRFVVTIAVIAAVAGVLIGGALWLMLRAVGVDGGTSASTQPTAPYTPLPTTALPVPKASQSGQPGGAGGPSSAPATSLSDSASSAAPSTSVGDITLVSAEDTVGSMQQIDLSGSWPNHDGVQLQVQRREGGRWVNFADVRPTVTSGTFTTYVMTGRTGRNVFRVIDPASKAVSNSVAVRVG